jgi:S1-C subfamily serine protease
MPDYLFSEEGMRIDGVSKNKTADKYGILKGDIVIQIGDIKVKDMMDYMKGLSKFEKGEGTIVKLKRDTEIIEIPIVFL